MKAWLFEKDKADDDVFEKKQKELEAASAVSVFTGSALQFSC